MYMNFELSEIAINIYRLITGQT